MMGSGIDLRRFMGEFAREYHHNRVFGEFEQWKIQQVFRVSHSKSSLLYIPVNHHYLEYDKAQTSLGVGFGVKDYNTCLGVLLCRHPFLEWIPI
jgi:hypothetical protein